VHPIYGTVRLHAGMDLAAPTGTPVKAAADAVVVSAAAHGGYGLAVVLDHGGALATLYGHLSRLLVRPGDVVRRGDRIGLVGSTGASTGPHLHFEVRVSGTPTDPTAYLRRPAPRREAPASVTAG
jgi:murein DD-endopeptidase MepM/ murein hydrolase activator NlpD